MSTAFSQETRWRERINDLYWLEPKDVGVVEEALREATETLGLEHLNVGDIMKILADSYRELGRYREAELLYNQALSISEKTFGPMHYYTLAVRTNRELLYEEMKKKGTPPIKQIERARIIRKWGLAIALIFALGGVWMLMPKKFLRKILYRDTKVKEKKDLEEDKIEKEAVFEKKGFYVPTLIKDEKILATFKSKFFEIGLNAALLLRKEHFIVTTHRIFQLTQQLALMRLRCLEIKKIRRIELRNEFNVSQLIIGLYLVGIFIFYEYFGDESAFWVYEWVHGELTIVEILSRLIVTIIGFVLLLTARRKVLEVSCGDKKNTIVFPFRPFENKQTKYVVDLIAKEVRNSTG